MAAVLAASAIFLGARFIGTGQFSSAQSDLNTALLTVEQIYAQVGEGGARNYVAAKVNGSSGATLACTVSATTTAVTIDTANSDEAAECLSEVAAAKLNALGEDLSFVAYEDNTSCTSPRVCKGGTGDEMATAIGNLSTGQVWVQVLPDSTALSGHAQMIRLGVKAENGATICAVVIKRAAAAADLGRHYQSANATASNDDTTVAACDLKTTAALSPSGYADSIVDPG